MKTTLALLLIALSAFGDRFKNPVMPGDFPDPSVIRVGDEYWATATTSEWAPLFPLLRSKDLVSWEHVGNVFTTRPSWAVGNFWAPEITEFKGTFFIYYVGRKANGPLSLAVATAPHPKGPWTDHGPLIGQDAGSIDGVAVTDDDGTRYLIWKEDGNSRKLPTPLWIQRLSPDGLKLEGKMSEVFRNDSTWEKNLVEGPYVMKKNGSWYLFYAGAGCCGKRCDYAVGVARAKNLTGPWEKYPGNPIVAGNENWKCPGHGTIVTDKTGRDYLAYHAYDAADFVYVGRQGLLDEVIWQPDGWPRINEGRGPSIEAELPFKLRKGGTAHVFEDNFNSGRLNPRWQWPQNNEPVLEFSKGELTLSPAKGKKDEFVAAVTAVKTTTGNYSAETRVNLKSIKEGVAAGLSAFGDSENALGLSIRNGKAIIWKRQKNQQEIVGERYTVHTIKTANSVWLRMNATDGHKFNFSLSTDGKKWTDLTQKIDLEGNYLPPWDRGIRVALTTGGPDAKAQFDYIVVRGTTPSHRVNSK